MKAIYILLALTLFASCKSKSKITDREKIKTEVAINEITSEKVVEEFISDKLESKKSILEKVNENSTEEIEADSTGVVTVQIKETDSGTVKIYTGVKKLKVTNEKTETKQTDTTSTKENINASKESETKNESFIKFKQETNKRKTDVEIKSTSTWFWLFLLIVVVLFLYWKRKSIF